MLNLRMLQTSASLQSNVAVVSTRLVTSDYYFMAVFTDPVTGNKVTKYTDPVTGNKVKKYSNIGLQTR